MLALAAIAYLAISAVALFWLWMYTGFCDPAEQECALPWTRRRVALWVGWSLLGAVVMVAAAVALRPRRGRLADKRIAAGTGIGVVVVGLALALLTAASNY